MMNTARFHCFDRHGKFHQSSDGELGKCVKSFSASARQIDPSSFPTLSLNLRFKQQRDTAADYFILPANALRTERFRGGVESVKFCTPSLYQPIFSTMEIHVPLVKVL